MKNYRMKNYRNLVLALGMVLVLMLPAGAQTWTPLTNQPPFYASTALLLTDGTVMVQEYAGDPALGLWWRLTPDKTGSYINGTWSQLASTPGYAPFDYASAVLPDGRVVVEGGFLRYQGDVPTNLGAIFTPPSPAKPLGEWAPVAPPGGWATIGGAQSAVLANGTFMLGNCCSNQALLNPSTLTWTPTGTGKSDLNAEGWTLLPNERLLMVDAWYDFGSELYDPSTGSWSYAGNTPVGLPNECHEIGPAILRPDGTVIAFGGTSNTAIYDTSSGAWSQGPIFPNDEKMRPLSVDDGAAALLPNGNVLVYASTTCAFSTAESKFFEFDGTNLIPAPAPGNAGSGASYFGRMLVLPTGQVFFLTDGARDVEIYTPGLIYDPAWQPTIGWFPARVTVGKTYAIYGTQFNGLSQGAMHGNHAQMATNYPLVRITNNASGHVFYAKTHDHSTMGVATGRAIVSTQFDVPGNAETGPSTLVVVANGIPSNPVDVWVLQPVDFWFTVTPIKARKFTLQGFNVTVTAVGGFNGTVTLSCQLGVSCSFNPTTIVGSGTSVLTGSQNKSDWDGVTVTATSGSLTHSLTLSFPPPDPACNPTPCQ